MIKGKEVHKAIEAAFKLKDPQELLEQSSETGKFLYARAEKLKKEYNTLLFQAKEQVNKEKFLIFTYPSKKTSFTKELANELSFLYPEKFIIVGREKEGVIKMSLRSKENIPTLLEKVFLQLKGYGGGHEQACGACISSEDLDRFVEILKENI